MMEIRKLKIEIIFFFVFLSFYASAQLTVSQGGTAQAMASTIVGPGVIVSNATINCPTISYGTFSGNTNVGLSNGILLTTGNINQVPGAANQGFFVEPKPSADNGAYGGDPDLTAIVSNATYNSCILEFDVIPVCDTLKITYVFASEEYPEYVCSSFNDVFGFFISGPNPSGGNYNAQNIAIIPGTNIAVAINSVNPGGAGANSGGGTCTSLAYSSLYVNNSSGTSIAFDGFTVPLVASVPVTSCQSYHMKLAIADAGDANYDSGVFLEYSGLTCPGTSVALTAIADTAIEGCVNGSVQITRTGDLNNPLTVNFTFSGNATNGTDYTLTNSITFSAGQSTITLPVVATADGITEGTEIAVITGSYTICGTTATTNSINIAIKDPPLISFSSSSPACGATDGSVTATPSGGKTPYSYVWNTTPVQNTATATGLPAGTYSVTVTDANGCITDSAVTIGTTPSLTLGVSSTPVSCNGGNNGTATVTASSGTTPYVYQWSTTPVQATQTATGLTAGTYAVTVSDNGGCQNTATVTVNSPSAIVPGTSSTAVTCQGGNDGTATVTASGGTTSYSFLWNTSPQQTTSTATGLIAGTYSVTVTDANSCSTSATVTVADGAPYADATITPAGPFCTSDAPATLSAVNSGGTWSGSGMSGNTFSPSVAGAGSHIITYTISGACGNSDTETILVNAVPDATINPVASLCTGSSPVTLTAATSGGIFSGNGVSGNSFNPFTAGAGTHTITYNITVSGCSNSDTETITVNQSMNADITPAGPFCLSNAALTLSAVDGGGLWSGNGITNASTGNFDPALAGVGTHEIIYAISAACGDTDTVSVLVSSVTVSLNNNTANASCKDTCNGSASVTASGGMTPYSYLWNDIPASTLDSVGNLCAGTYQCVVTSATGCKDSAQVTIAEPAAISITPFASFNATCYNYCDGYAITIPSGGTQPYSYAWSNGDSIATAGNLCAGPFSFTLTDANGCTKDTAFSITQPSQAFINVDSAAANCKGSCDGSATATANGSAAPFTYQWSGNANFQNTQTATGLCVGTYSVTATDTSGCKISATIGVSEPTQVDVSVSPDRIICLDSTAIISANGSGGSGNYTFFWNNGTGTPQGFMQVSAADTAEKCYTVFVTDSKNCPSDTDTVCIKVFPLLTVAVFSDTVICRNQSVNLSAITSGGNGTMPVYNWSGIGQMQNTSVYPPGDFPDTVYYVVSASDNCAPLVKDSVMITFFEVPVINYTVDSSFGCEPYEVTFSNNTPNADSCIWDLGDGSAALNCGTFTHVYGVGTYWVDLAVVSADGCRTVISPASLITVNPNPFAGFSFLPESSTVMDPTVNFTDVSSGQINLWNWTFYDNDGNNTILGTSQEENPSYTFPGDTGVFPVNLHVTTESGCTDDTTLYVFIEGEFIFWTPNAFTPNADGSNDFFPPLGIGINGEKFALYIFDRWGDLIFESHNLNDPWDGTARELGGSEIVPQGVYVWKIVLEDNTRNPRKHEFIGHVTLLK